jgi:uncharacterized membrane protein
MSDRHTDLGPASRRWFGRQPEALEEAEARVLLHAAERRIVARPPEAGAPELGLGERLADRGAEFGGSWSFILGFGLCLALWVGLNSLALARPFDPYPYIFLNLILSMIAAIQAPIIMMSQNRQAAKDRQTAALDYEVNLKAEIEIMALHDKLDRLRDENLVALLKAQEKQIGLLSDVLAGRTGSGPRPGGQAGG